MMPPIKMFQFWDRPEPPQEVAVLMTTWQAGFAEGYHLFDLEAARAYVAERVSARAAEAFAKCKVPAMQADFFRYCVLWCEGGLYADADTALTGDLAGYLAGAPRGLLMDRRGKIANDIMYFRQARDPLLAQVLDIAIQNVETEVSANVWIVTGPGILTDLYNRTETRPLFDDITMPTVRQVGEYVRFVWTLGYKSDESDWRNMGKGDKREIFN